MRTRNRRWGCALVLVAALLLLPDASPAPARLNLIKVEGAKAVDFEDGVVWFLALGSDAGPGEDMMRARADAIELVAVNFEVGSAVALGIPRDSWVELGDEGFHKINDALALGGGSTELMVAEVVELAEIIPDYVAVTDLVGFAGLVKAIGGVRVRSAFAFDDLSIERGVNHLDGEQASGFAQSRDVPGDDLSRIANQQALLRGILDRIRDREDQVDFLENGAVAALRFLDTTLGPTDLYRLAQAISRIELGQFDACVIRGHPSTVGALSVINLNVEQLRRVAQDAADDAALQNGCR